MARDGDHDPPRSANYPPGFDEADPYDKVELGTYPEWWRQNIREFRKYGMRPYRPPRFQDGALTPEVISQLEADLNVTIDLRAINPRVNEDWSVWVDGARIGQIGRERTGDGHTEYHMTAAEFEQLVRTATPDVSPSTDTE
jgi:hypothetical protein